MGTAPRSVSIFALAERLHGVILQLLVNILVNKMTEEQPNISLLNRLDLRNLAAAKDLIAEDVIWRFVDGRIVEVWDIVHGHPAESNDAGH